MGSASRLIPSELGRPTTIARRSPAAASRRMPGTSPEARLAEMEGTRLEAMAIASAVGTLMREMTRPE